MLQYENLPFIGTVTEIGIVLLSEEFCDPIHGQYLHVTLNISAPWAPSSGLAR